MQDGSSYTVEAAINATNQPIGYTNAGTNLPYEVTASWKALLHPTAAGGDYVISATCAGCDDANTTITMSNITFGDMWYCSGQSNVRSFVRRWFVRSLTAWTLTRGYLLSCVFVGVLSFVVMVSNMLLLLWWWLLLSARRCGSPWTTHSRATTP